MVLGKGGYPDGASAAFEFGWRLTARPGHECSLQGYPDVWLSALNGSWSFAGVVPDDFTISPGAVLDAQHPGVVQFRWGYDASGYTPEVPLGPFRVTFALPHSGGTLSAVAPSTGWDQPGRRLPTIPTHLGRVVAEPLGGFERSVYDGVYAHPDSATIVATEPIRAATGGIVSYDVWLRPSITSGPGPACFGYRQRLVDWKTGAVIAQDEHELACNDLAGLPITGRLFSMRLAVPRTVEAGEPVEVQWQADTGAADAAELDLGTPAEVPGRSP